MVIYIGFTHWKLWFSIVMLIYQRVYEFHHDFTSWRHWNDGSQRWTVSKWLDMKTTIFRWVNYYSSWLRIQILDTIILSLIIFHHYLKIVYLWTPYCRDLEVGQLGVDYLQKVQDGAHRPGPTTTHCRRAQPNGPKGSLGIFDNIPFDAVPSWFEGCGVSRAGGTSISSAPPMRPSGGTPMVNVCLSHFLTI